MNRRITGLCIELANDPINFVYVSEQVWMGEKCVYVNHAQSNKAKYIRNVTIPEILQWAQGISIEDAMPNIDQFDRVLLESMEKGV